MNRSSRSNRFGLASGLRHLLGKRKKTTADRSAADLAHAAGGADQAFEALETRQLLFTLAITPQMVNPLTGLGTASATFAYFIPTLRSPTLINVVAPTTADEDFNENDPGIPIAAVPSGFVFNGTANLRVDHNLTQLQLNQVQAGENFLRAVIGPGEAVSFGPVGGQTAPTSNFRSAVTSMAMDISGGLNAADITAEFLDTDGNVISSVTGAALDALGLPSTGPTRRYTFSLGTQQFSQIRFVSSAGAASDSFDVDNVFMNVAGRTFDTFLTSTIFGATVSFSGPAGATAQFLDLYGQEIRATTVIGSPNGVQFVIADPEGDGIPNYNDGIGRINVAGTDEFSTLTMFGGTVDQQGVFTITPNPVGIFDAFEAAGFGYNAVVQAGGAATITGLPPGPGSVILGAPWVRPQGNYNPGGLPSGPSNFLRADQGVFVTGGANIGSVYIHGIVHGSSQFSGSVGKLILGLPLGSNSVNGDLTTFVSGGDAAMLVDDDGGPVVKTNAQLVVGRTIGEIMVGGRSLMNVTVIGDLGRPSLYPPRDIFRYFEKEYSPNSGTQPQVVTTINGIMGAGQYLGLNNIFAGDGLFFGRAGQQIVWNTSYIRNDSIMDAEWIGTAATAVQINGELGANDPVLTQQDRSDVYAFAVDGSQDIVVDLSGGLIAQFFGVYARLVDGDGRTVVATPLPDNDRRTATSLRYRPNSPGVYYLVVSTRGDATAVTDVNYVMTVSGMAAANLGAYRTAGGYGFNQPNLANTLNVLSGSMGSMRIGTGFMNGAGAVTDPSGIYNMATNDNTDSSMAFRGSTTTIPGTLYNITTGSDVEGGTVTINIGRNLGTIITGQSPVLGLSANNGDFRTVNLTVGGSIAMFDIRGALGIDQDPTTFPKPPDFASSVFIRTGTNAQLRGDIGMIRVGWHVGAGTLSLRTPNGSIVGGLLVSQDVTDGAGIYQGIYGAAAGNTGLDLQLGSNSDLRFFDTPLIWQQNVPGVQTPLLRNTPVTFTDDGGAQVQIQIVAPTGSTASGNIKVIPISGSLGVAIGRIEVDLTGGARLVITGQGPAGSTKVVSIGHILITGADAASSIGIQGNTQVDVWKIDQTGGDALLSISNISPLGDIVAADVIAMNSLDIRTGDLGRTQMPAWGPQRIGPFLGIARGAGGDVGGVIGVPGNVMTAFWNGALYRPINQTNSQSPPASWMDDVGSPVDPYLDGLIVRTGDIISVQVGGAVGDVIAATGNVIQVTANFDNITPLGRFDGIVGNIYGNRISLVEVGDGLSRGVVGSPLVTTGIAANDDILTIRATRPGAFLSGYINAANQTPGNTDPNNFPTDGVNLIDLPGGGDMVDLYVGAMSLDQFWDSFYPDDAVYQGSINLIRSNGGNLLRSNVIANFINTMTLTNGFFDASTMQAASDISRIETAGYRNSTITGSDLELRINQILVGRNLGVLTTTGRTGDIKDLVVDVLGATTEISARNMDRSSFDSDISIASLIATGSIRGSAVTTGLLTSATIAHNLSSSRVSSAGPLMSLTVGDAIINSAIASTGPDGRIDKITARTGMSGSVSSAGPIDTLEVTEGDMTIAITTVTNQRGDAGNIRLLKASRDLNISTDIGGTVEQMVAGRHIGRQVNPGVILVRGSVELVDAPNGQLYSDLRIGQTLTTINIGAVPNLPGNSLVGLGSIIAFGRIETANIEGDFGGKIQSASGGIGLVHITDGSLLYSGSITALDGDIGNVIITNGHLFGNIHADYILFSVRVEGSDDGVMGDIGVNPNLSQGTGYDANRNQLPPGVLATPAIQGPRITAGKNIGRITVTNGSIFEAFIYAVRAIGTVDVNGNITKDSQTIGQGTVIAAGSSIFTVRASGNMGFTDVLAGIRGFGDDNAPGGTGSAADTVQSGRITTVHADGTGNNVRVSAGMNAGADGQYNTFDETVALGISYVREVTFDGGVISSVSVFADSPTLDTSANVIKAGTSFPTADGDLSSGAPVGTQLTSDVVFGFTWGGVSGTILFSGPGRAYWDGANGRVHLVNTKLSTTLTVSATGLLNDFDIVTNDDASMGQISVSAPLAGDSDIVVDAYSLGISVGDFAGTGQIKSGMNIRSIVTGNFFSGSIAAAFWVRQVTITGNYGQVGVTGEARIDALAGSTISVAGVNAGLINVERDLTTLNSGSMNGAQFRAGNTVGAINAGSMFEVRISAGDSIGPIDVDGDANDTQILSGGDLGSDAAPGGTGFNADRATTGFIGTVTIGGNFARSSLVAGMLRGPDGYFGTTDDQVGPGRSTIGDVTIGGSEIGSNIFTEQYRISATGSVGDVEIGGAPGGNVGNFQISTLATEPTPIRVVDLQVTQESNDWKATFFFNQPLDSSTFAPALTVSEVRNGGLVIIPLVQGVDYVVGAYNANNNSIAITFSRDITDRNLVPQGGVPAPGSATPGAPDPNLAGPGYFRFELSADVLRARVATARLDGDSNGFAAANEDYSQDNVVGDAGDKIDAEVINNAEAGNPDEIIDMYGPVDMDMVLDNNLAPDGLPETNLPFVLRGTIGDHPDNNINTFRAGGDVDIYKITLQAGQILRLGAMEGPARFTGRILLNSTFQTQNGTSDDTVQLPANASSLLFDTTSEDAFLIKTTGTYYLVMGNTTAFLAPGVVPNVPPGSGDTGAYSFTVEVFDDGDTGFNAATNAGNGTPVVNAPASIVFAGPNGVFQDPGDPSYDDLTVVPIGDYQFTLDPGADGIRGTADDVVSGSNNTGITSTRNGSNLTSQINSAIGPRGHTGVPSAVSSDVDIYHLNNGLSIAPGTLITVKIKLADLGADLGAFSRETFTDYRGAVQFGIFDTTGASALDDANLVISPTDFLPRAGDSGEIARNGQMAYGYDDNGDFYITFITPSRLGGTGAGTFAVYLQGAYNTDYTIEVTQNEAAPTQILPQSKQNLFIETRGGVIDWLEAGGLSTNVSPFATSVLGLTGNIGGVPVDQYVLTHLVTELQSIFDSTGLNIEVSTNPNAFEFEDFSTVFVTASTDPITVTNTDNYGYSEHSDPMNMDKNDEGVVFLPSLASLGYTPTQSDVDEFVLSLAAAVGRRAGELMGLRMTSNSSSIDAPIDIMSANSVNNVPTLGNAYGYPDASRALSTRFDTSTDTDFFFGRQNAFQLLDKFLTP